MKRFLCILLCLLMLLPCALPVLAADGVPKEVMEATKSVVRILSEYKRDAATGSGFVIKNDGTEILIATNNHVVDDNPKRISVWVGENRQVDAEIVFTTSAKDLCVLRLTEYVDMAPLTLSREDAQHGAAIYVVGYPGAGDVLSDTQAHTSDSVTITDGIISAIRTFTIEKGAAPVKLLQVNAAINSGNSGGPLFNTKGEVIGVNTYKVNVDSQGVFGSVDIGELWSLLDEHGITIAEEEKSAGVADLLPMEEPEKAPAFLLPIAIGAAAVVLLLVLMSGRRKKKAKAAARKPQTTALTDHMLAYPDGLGIGGAVSTLLPVAIRLRNLHNDGRLHLQVCPENIRIGAEGALLKEPTGQESGRFNNGFASPEIYRGAGFGITSDVYSFAALLLYAATGKVPANSLQPEALEQDLALLDNADFAGILRRAMASGTADRIQSIQELIYGIAVYNIPVQKKQPQPLRTVETVPASVREERPAPVKEEQVKIPKHRKKTVPKKKHRKLMPIAAVLVCGIVAVVLMWKPAEKQEETAELQSTEQAETTVPMTPEEAAYAKAENLLANGETAKAAIAFGKLGDYKDARQRSFELWREVMPSQTISAGKGIAAAIKEDGTVVIAGYDDSRQKKADQWTDMVSICIGGNHTVGLTNKGTVAAVGATHFDKSDVDFGADIVQIAAGGNHTVGLKSDGTVLAQGDTRFGCCNVEDWKDIVAIAADGLTVGLKMDGTVVATGGSLNDDDGRCNVSGWRDIVAVDAGNSFTVGLQADGTVLVTGAFIKEYTGIKDITGSVASDWKDIVAISAGTNFFAGLKGDGTVVVTNDAYGYNLEEPNWTDIIAISAGSDHLLGLKSDGTVVMTGPGNSQVLDWTDIKLPN